MSEMKKITSILTHPRTQAITTGALVLIPARRYSRWLRQTLTWGTSGAVAALIAVPGATSEVIKRASGHDEIETVNLSPTARAGLALGAGALFYGSWQFSWWFDEASERTLRRLRVPFPRAVMGAACGAWYWRTEKDRQRGSDPDAS